MLIAMLCVTREEYWLYNYINLYCYNRELVSLLHDRHITVYLISGGFSQLIQPIAHAVGISTEHIYCNELVFDDKGQLIIIMVCHLC